MKGRPAIVLNPDSVLIFKLPGSLVRDASEEHSHDFLPMVFNDLVVEGLYKDGHKGLPLSSGIGDLFESLWFLNDKGITFLSITHFYIGLKGLNII
ncbi:hypothetical protein LXL04_011226 [Taraxacum kok-saghyz]